MVGPECIGIIAVLGLSLEPRSCETGAHSTHCSAFPSQDFSRADSYARRAEVWFENAGLGEHSLVHAFVQDGIRRLQLKCQQLMDHMLGRGTQHI
eukprot:5682489-Amphidinium_carterae.1